VSLPTIIGDFHSKVSSFILFCTFSSKFENNFLFQSFTFVAQIFATIQDHFISSKSFNSIFEIFFQ
jgi:hypothetical protein